MKLLPRYLGQRSTVIGFGLATLLTLLPTESRAEGERRAWMRTRIDHDRTALNTIYAEAFGPGGLYSVNYDRILYKWFSARVGFSYSPIHVGTSERDKFKANMTTIPIIINAMLGARGHYGEVGFGPTLRFYGDPHEDKRLEKRTTAFNVAGTLVLGYRFNPLGSGVNFRVGFSPFFGKNAGFNYRTKQTSNASAWGYMSIGISI